MITFADWLRTVAYCAVVASVALTGYVIYRRVKR